MRIKIRYESAFEYPEAVRESHNVLRACPADDEHQTVHRYEVHVAPTGRIQSYRDYWGTRVDSFGIRRPHGSLVVSAEADVTTGERPAPKPGAPMSRYGSDAVVLGHHSYLQRSPHADWSEDLGDEARDTIGGLDTAVEAVVALHDHVADVIDYAPGATYVGMDVNDVRRRRKGVCQDFAHLAIAMYRSAGIPARYVSGYLYAADQTVAVAPEIAEIINATHAWVEAFVPGFGWWGIDPTNPTPVGELHVKIGHGRDYDDVMPLRGVYHGPADHKLGVSVTMSREQLSQAQSQQQQ